MATSDPLINRKLGDYVIQSLLGKGGMARVYKGYDANLDRYAAIKVISSELMTGDTKEYNERFNKEARAIARLSHPNIVGIYQFGESDGSYYMAMQFLDGEDLRAILRRYAKRGERMPTSQILRMARDIAQALDYAHDAGVVHRDIKPSNIMVLTDGRSVLTDFGLALNANEGTQGDTFGTAHYIAPEQAISSANAVRQSDQYAFGVVLYEAFVGQVPFDEPSAMSVALKHLQEPPPPPTRFNPSLPAEAERVLLKALSKAPKDRYPTCVDFVEALTKALGTYENATGSIEGATQPKAPALPLSDSAASLEAYLRSVEQATGRTSGQVPPSDLPTDMRASNMMLFPASAALSKQ